MVKHMGSGPHITGQETVNRTQLLGGGFAATTGWLQGKLNVSNL
jgi:hypothetical protein